MKHSPAPWTLQGPMPMRGGRTYTCIRDARNICIAVVGEVDAATDGAEQIINARLMMGAPELLAALEAVVAPYDEQNRRIKAAQDGGYMITITPEGPEIAQALARGEA